MITGVVRTAAGEAVAGAYVRLLDSTGEFTAEVVTSPAGQFRFFAAPGTWTLRALSRHGNGDVDRHRRPRRQRGDRHRRPLITSTPTGLSACPVTPGSRGSPVGCLPTMAA